MRGDLFAAWCASMDGSTLEEFIEHVRGRGREYRRMRREQARQSALSGRHFAAAMSEQLEHMERFAAGQMERMLNLRPGQMIPVDRLGQVIPSGPIGASRAIGGLADFVTGMLGRMGGTLQL